jgi:hypothetical protein
VTVEVFGVTATHFAAYLPQVEILASGAPLTDARLSEVVEGAAASVAAAIVAAWGDVVATIAADAASTAYRNCQYCTVVLATPHVVEAAHHLIDGEAFDRLEERARDLRAQLFKDPSRVIGYAPALDVALSGSVATSTAALDLPQDTASKQTRRRFGGRRVGVNEGGWQY